MTASLVQYREEAVVETNSDVSPSAQGENALSSQELCDVELRDAYEAFLPLVVRRCRRILRQDEAAQDAAQDVFLRLCRYGTSYLSADSKIAWLYQVADRVCFDRLKKDKRRAEVMLDDLAELESASMNGLLEDREALMHFLTRFDDRVKKAIVLYYLKGASQQEIADATGWSRQTVSNKLAFVRARARSLRTGLLR
jgi:RNA polymerase sigma-70 factor (ECF subfamily)